MKLKVGPGLLLVVWLMVGMAAAAPVTAQSAAGSQLRLVSTGERSLVLELTVADYQLEATRRQGQTYHRVLIDGLVQTDTPGQPQAPARGVWLGVPQPEGVTVEVLETEVETLSSYRLLPAPTVRPTGPTSSDAPPTEIESVFTLDAARYATNAFYPDRLVTLGDTGYLRDQAVVQVRFTPVQTNPVTGELRLYRRILARVSWPGSLSPAAAAAPPASPIFEPVLQKTLLNYEALPRPGLAARIASPRAPDTGSLTAAATTAALKLIVTETGFYEVTYSDLTGAGFDLTGVDPGTLKLSQRGVELAIEVTGQADGVFDPGDRLRFYGLAYEDVYTRQNVYWLTAGGANGKRITTRSGAPSGSATVPPHFPVTLHFEEDTAYWLTMPNGEGQDHWFWGDFLNANATRNVNVTLPHVSPAAGSAAVRVRLKGHTDDLNTSPNHHTRISLNGTQIDDQLWTGFNVFDHQTPVAPGLLDNGNNTVRVRSMGDTGAAVDQVYVNWIEVDYWRTYQADGDTLAFGPPATGTFQFDLTGFSQNTGRVFDITDPANPVQLTDPTLVSQGGGFTLRVEDAAQATSRYLALTPARHKSPAALILDQPSDWQTPGHGADYIIITHDDFVASAQTLAAYHAVAGLRLAVVKVGDLYDEFNHGIFNPRAIRDFLAYAYANWTAPAPAYVLLLGGASYDYRDLLDLDRANFVPTQLIETDTLGETPSDNWFVLVNGSDPLPDMFIGRLTPQTPAEAADMVAKVIAYQQNPPGAAWNKQVLLVADDDSATFEDISDQLAAALPYDYTANKVYAGNYPPGSPTSDIRSRIDAGQVLVNYTGHGNVDMWGVWQNGHIFDASNVPSLNNANRLPVVTVANCLNGFFAGKSDSMAEAFLRRPDKGAVAVWAATSLGYPSGHRVLLDAFYRAIFQQDQYTLGAATTAAKLAVYAQGSAWAELVETFVLFGDPALALGIPPNRPYVDSTTPANGAAEVLVDQPLQIDFNRPMNPATVSLSDGGLTGLTFSPAWNADQTRVTYSHPAFAFGQSLTLTMTGQDHLGLPLGPGPVPTTWSFTTYGLPFVTTTDPTDDASNAPIDQPLQIVFNKPMDPATISLSGSGAAGSVFSPTWNTAQTILSYSHTDFDHGQLLAFTITGEDVLGNPLDPAKTSNAWSFTVTTDALPPQAVLGLAVSDTIDVPPSAGLIITFNEPVRPDSLVTRFDPALPTSLTWDAAGQIATFTHLPFQWATTYTFHLTLAKDRAGNALVTPLSLSFTTMEGQSIYLPLLFNEE